MDNDDGGVRWAQRVCAQLDAARTVLLAARRLLITATLLVSALGVFLLMVAHLLH